MKDDITIGEITNFIQNTSTDFERTNTDIKRRYLLWIIDAFNRIASRVSVSRGSFGTGYPFYALNPDLNGTLPIIPEQIRYNRQLVKDGKPFQKSIWKCKSCLRERYSTMQDLKKICGPCPNVDSLLKPRKLINRLPDMDMWIVCKDGTTEIAQEELTRLLAENNMRTSDVDPILSIEEVAKIAQTLKSGKMPETILPMDVHIIEYSTLKELIERVPSTLKKSKEDQTIPYLPIQPKSYRKYWQFDDSAYNYVYDYLTAFTEFNFEEKLQESLIRSRKEVFENNSLEELFEFALQAATPANFRRFQEPQLEEKFRMRVQRWQGIPVEQEKELDEDYEIEL